MNTRWGMFSRSYFRMRTNLVIVADVVVVVVVVVVVGVLGA